MASMIYFKTGLPLGGDSVHVNLMEYGVAVPLIPYTPEGSPGGPVIL